MDDRDTDAQLTGDAMVLAVAFEGFASSCPLSRAYGAVVMARTWRL